jgi:pyruvate/2-oxoglutarate dehydrogenase complex dihydrolipoamide acyltransferase (E2) component
MHVLYLVLLAVVGVPAASAAESPNPGAAATQPADAKSPVARLKENPNDAAALNQYMLESLRRIATVMDADPKAAEQTLEEMKQLLESLKPDAEPAKQALGRAKASIGFYERQLEVARTSLEEIGNRLKANPDDGKALSMSSPKSNGRLAPSRVRNRTRRRPT